MRQLQDSYKREQCGHSSCGSDTGGNRTLKKEMAVDRDKCFRRKVQEAREDVTDITWEVRKCFLKEVGIETKGQQ